MIKLAFLFLLFWGMPWAGIIDYSQCDSIGLWTVDEDGFWAKERCFDKIHKAYKDSIIHLRNSDQTQLDIYQSSMGAFQNSMEERAEKLRGEILAEKDKYKSIFTKIFIAENAILLITFILAVIK